MSADKKKLFARPTHNAGGQASTPAIDQWVTGGEAAAQTQHPATPPETSTSESASLPNTPELDETPKRDEIKRLTIDIPKSLHARVKSACAANGESIADVVRKILEKKFPDPNKQKQSR